MDVTTKHGYIVINGDYYEAKRQDGEQIFKKVPKKKVEKRLKFVNEMVKKLKDSLDKEAILRESLMKIADNDLETLYGILNNPTKKYKPKTREHRCVDMKIGNFILPIVD